MILDAVRAPIGSTKRTHAINTLNSLYSAHSNRAQKTGITPQVPIIPAVGQGGPATTPPMVNMAPTVLSLKPIC